MAFHDLEGQRERRREVADLLVEYTRDNWTPEGEWTNGEWSIADGGGSQGLRVRFWYAVGYFESDRDAADLANSIVVGAPEFGHCKFAPMDALRLLVAYREQLTDPAKRRLREYLRSELLDFETEDLDFNGLNDNFPAMATCMMLLGGELFDREDWFDIGHRRLAQLEALLTRRGVVSEYNSPTYTPITTFAIAVVANHTDDDAIRERALRCEQRLWVDLLGHYHPPTSQIAGPYSRAYKVNSAGHTHNARAVLYALLGDRLAVTPPDTLFSGPEGAPDEIIHKHPAFMQASMVEWMSTDLHCPDSLVDGLGAKTYPYRIAASTEAGTHDGYRADSGRISTYMTEDYALGVARKPFLDGDQSDAFHLLYRRARPATEQADIGAVYSRYRLDERVLDPAPTETLLRDQGQKFAVADGNTALVAYHSDPAVRPDSLADVRSMRLSLVVPTHYGTVDHLQVGDRAINVPAADAAPVTVEKPAPVFVRDGPVYLGFRPLVRTDGPHATPITIQHSGTHVYVSLYNYDGTVEDAPVDEETYRRAANGFAVECRSAREVADFDAFAAALRNADLTQSFRGGLRSITYEAGDTRLGLEYDPEHRGLKHATVDGTVPTGRPLEIDGVDIEDLPYR